jgi:hypothetical protein
MTHKYNFLKLLTMALPEFHSQIYDQYPNLPSEEMTPTHYRRVPRALRFSVVGSCKPDRGILLANPFSQ